MLSGALSVPSRAQRTSSAAPSSKRLVICRRIDRGGSDAKNERSSRAIEEPPPLFVSFSFRSPLLFSFFLSTSTLSLSLSGQNIRKLVKDGFILKKPCKIHSRSRARAAAEAKAKGRHTGYGKRRG